METTEIKREATPFQKWLLQEQRFRTWESIAAQVGVSRQMVHKWLSGQARPSKAMLPHLANVTGLKYEDILP